VPRKVFVAGEILTASDVNTFLGDQSVFQFADAAARGSAIPSPVEGMAAYLEDQNILSLYDGSAWKNSLGVTGGILQVVHDDKTDTQTSSLASGASIAVSGLSASITPKSSSSLILVFVQLSLSHSGGEGASVLVRRDGTLIGPGDSSESRTRVTSGGGVTPSGRGLFSTNTIVYDSPNTTSSITYTVDILNQSDASRTLYVNRPDVNDNAAYVPAGASRIVLMEVAG
jgi:hypothetical protein